MGLGLRLKAARESGGITREQLASMVGVTRSAISNYENEISHPKVPIIYALMKALDVDANYLYMEEEDAAKASLSIQAQRIARAYEKAVSPVQRTVEVALEPYMDVLKVYADEPAAQRDEPQMYANQPDHVVFVDFSQSYQAASAGTGVDLAEECMHTLRVRLDALPKGYERTQSRYFGVPVSGNSMEPRYHDGDILIVSREPVDLGEVGVFMMDGEGYVKQLGRGALHSLNKDYADIPLTEDVQCSGKVVGVLDPAAIDE